MLFTIDERPINRKSLEPEAASALQALQRQARLLRGISASVLVESLAVVEQYERALALNDPSAWRAFVAAADAIARHLNAIGDVVPLAQDERAACLFFAAIADENRDLIAA